MRHPDELHRQDDAERGGVDAPLLRDAGRRKADREHVEAVEALSAMVIATTATCSRLIGAWAITSLGSVDIGEEYTHPPEMGFVIRNVAG